MLVLFTLTPQAKRAVPSGVQRTMVHTTLPTTNLSGASFVEFEGSNHDLETIATESAEDCAL